METLLLSKSDVERLVNVKDTIGVVEEVYRGHAEGTVVMPPKLSMDLGESGKWPHFESYINSMPAYIGSYKIAGVKIIGGFFANVGTSLPSIQGLILLVDPLSGVPLAIMDGAYITALRTGASVAVAAKYLAKKGSSTLTLIGAGTQCRYSLRALSQVAELDRVRVTDIRKDAAALFASEMSKELSLNVEETEVPDQLFDSDIIVSATTSKTPVIRGSMLKKGCLVEPLGSYQEIDGETALGATKIFVDNMDQARHRGSFASLIEEGVITADRITGEISEVVVGKKKGRESEDDTIIFEPIGIGSTDIATACFAYERARSAQSGARFAFS